MKKTKLSQIYRGLNLTGLGNKLSQKKFYLYLELNNIALRMAIQKNTVYAMTGFNIESILEKLSKNRPVFHNEADFQFTLAWEIQKHHKEYGIRLEYKVPRFDKRYTDIWINASTPISIELKYKPVSTILEINNESFELKPHGAQDIGRYDVLKDLQRIEDIVKMQGHKPCKTYSLKGRQEQ